jgi:hypothetical protein
MNGFKINCGNGMFKTCESTGVTGIANEGYPV